MIITLCNICKIFVKQKYETPLILNGMVVKEVSWLQGSELDSPLQYTSIACTAHVKTGCTVQLKCDGTRWRRVGKWRGKLANGVGSRYSSHYFGTWLYPALLPLMRILRLPEVDWTDAPRLNSMDWSVSRERRNLVSAHVPSYFDRAPPLNGYVQLNNGYFESKHNDDAR